MSNLDDHEASPIMAEVDEEGTPVRGQSFLTQQSQNVRYNVIADGVAQTGGADRSHFVVLVIQTIMQLPPGLAAIFIVLMGQDTCDESPLTAWALIYGMTLGLSVSVGWTMYRSPAESQTRQWAETIRKPLDNFCLVLLILGQIWVQSAPECADTSPVIFTLCFWLVVQGFCYLLLPCIVIILMLPFLCFCLPCVIRLLARFAGTELSGRTGASKEMIAKLSKKTFHADLFTGESDPQCSICLCSYEEGQDVRILPCDGRHHFHQDCIDEWLIVNATCPICRAKVVDNDNIEEENNMV